MDSYWVNRILKMILAYQEPPLICPQRSSILGRPSNSQSIQAACISSKTHTTDHHIKSACPSTIAFCSFSPRDSLVRSSFSVSPHFHLHLVTKPRRRALGPTFKDPVPHGATNLLILTLLGSDLLFLLAPTTHHILFHILESVFSAISIP